MGSWGITMRESDYGLDLLNVIIEEQLKPIQFVYFDTGKAIGVLRQHILEEIIYRNQNCSQTKLDHYIRSRLQQYFSRAALLIAECLEEYYRTNELIVHEYIKTTGNLQERHIQQVLVTEEAVSVLLKEVRCVQNPEHEMYQSWLQEKTRQEWLVHVQALQKALEHAFDPSAK